MAETMAEAIAKLAEARRQYADVQLAVRGITDPKEPKAITLLQLRAAAVEKLADAAQSVILADAEAAEEIAPRPRLGHTPGPWRVGAHGTVVCDAQHEGNHVMKAADSMFPGFRSDLDFYRGHLLAESIARPADAVLMALSPELLDFAKEVFAYLDALDDRERLYGPAQAMLDKSAALISRSERIDE